MTNQRNLDNFETELTRLINKYSLENIANIPDFILAKHLVLALTALSMSTINRDVWYGKIQKPGEGNYDSK